MILLRVLDEIWQMMALTWFGRPFQEPQEYSIIGLQLLKYHSNNIIVQPRKCDMSKLQKKLTNNIFKRYFQVFLPENC